MNVFLYDEPLMLDYVRKVISKPLVGQDMAAELGAPAGLPYCPLCLANL